MNRTPLTIDVHVAPMRPFIGPPPQGPGDDAVWSPMSSTLISGERDAVLVDVPITVDQVDVLIDWVKASGKHLTTVYITHGHSDHWMGLGRLLEAFPGARGVALPEVVARAQFETSTPAIQTYWNTSFEGALPEQRILPEALTGSIVELEDQALHAIAVGQSDTEHSTVLHVPSARAVVAGDVVYNGVHMMTAETDPAGRRAWIANLDTIAALKPSIVVSGHKKVGTENGPEQIVASQAYLRDFDAVLERHDSVEGIVAAMLELHGDRDNPRVLWHGARTALARRSTV